MSESSRRRLLFVIVLLSLPLDSQAYLDPNAGGLIYQLLFPIGVILSAAWTFCRQRMQTFMRQVIAKLRPKHSKSQKQLDGD